MKHFIISFIHKYRCQIKEILFNDILDDEDLYDASIDVFSNDTLDEYKSEFDNESSTIDKGLDNQIKHRGQTKKQDGIAIILGIIGGDSSNGGDSETADEPMNNLGIWRVIKSFINGLIINICEVFDRILPKIPNFIGWVSSAHEYVNSYIDTIPKWVIYLYYSGITLYLIYRRITKIQKIYQFDFRWMLPSFTTVKKPNDGELVLDHQHLKEWSNPPHFNNWIFAKNICYGFNHLKRIRQSLGLRLINKALITRCFVAKAFVDRGLRLFIEGDISTALMRVSTRIYDPKLKKYLFYFFNILVYMGVGVVVWYQVIPSAGVPPAPTGFDTEFIPVFQDPTSIVEGYKRVTYLLTKDITSTVISTYKNDFLFRNILSIEEYNLPDVGSKHRLACIGTALMMAVFITTKTIPA